MALRVALFDEGGPAPLFGAAAAPPPAPAAASGAPAGGQGLQQQPSSGRGSPACGGGGTLGDWAGKRSLFGDGGAGEDGGGLFGRGASGAGGVDGPASAHALRAAGFFRCGAPAAAPAGPGCAEDFFRDSPFWAPSQTTATPPAPRTPGAAGLPQMAGESEQLADNPFRLHTPPPRPAAPAAPAAAAFAEGTGPAVAHRPAGNPFRAAPQHAGDGPAEAARGPSAAVVPAAAAQLADNPFRAAPQRGGGGLPEGPGCPGAARAAAAAAAAAQASGIQGLGSAAATQLAGSPLRAAPQHGAAARAQGAGSAGGASALVQAVHASARSLAAGAPAADDSAASGGSPADLAGLFRRVLEAPAGVFSEEKPGEDQRSCKKPRLLAGPWCVLDMPRYAPRAGSAGEPGGRPGCQEARRPAHGAWERARSQGLALLERCA